MTRRTRNSPMALRHGGESIDQPRRIGSVNVYRLLTLQGQRVTLNLVWAMEAALRDQHWMDLPPEANARIWPGRGILPT